MAERQRVKRVRKNSDENENVDVGGNPPPWQNTQFSSDYWLLEIADTIHDFDKGYLEDLSRGVPETTLRDAITDKLEQLNGSRDLPYGIRRSDIENDTTGFFERKYNNLLKCGDKQKDFTLVTYGDLYDAATFVKLVKDFSVMGIRDNMILSDEGFFLAKTVHEQDILVQRIADFLLYFLYPNNFIFNNRDLNFTIREGGLSQFFISVDAGAPTTKKIFAQDNRLFQIKTPENIIDPGEPGIIFPTNRFMYVDSTNKDNTNQFWGNYFVQAIPGSATTMSLESNPAAMKANPFSFDLKIAGETIEFSNDISAGASIRYLSELLKATLKKTGGRIPTKDEINAIDDDSEKKRRNMVSLAILFDPSLGLTRDQLISILFDLKRMGDQEQAAALLSKKANTFFVTIDRLAFLFARLCGVPAIRDSDGKIQLFRTPSEPSPELLVIQDLNQIADTLNYLHPIITQLLSLDALSISALLLNLETYVGPTATQTFTFFPTTSAIGQYCNELILVRAKDAYTFFSALRDIIQRAGQNKSQQTALADKLIQDYNALVRLRDEVFDSLKASLRTIIQSMLPEQQKNVKGFQDLPSGVVIPIGGSSLRIGQIQEKIRLFQQNEAKQYFDQIDTQYLSKIAKTKRIYKAADGNIEYIFTIDSSFFKNNKLLSHKINPTLGGFNVQDVQTIYNKLTLLTSRSARMNRASVYQEILDAFKSYKDTFFFTKGALAFESFTRVLPDVSAVQVDGFTPAIQTSLVREIQTIRDRAAGGRNIFEKDFFNKTILMMFELLALQKYMINSLPQIFTSVPRPFLIVSGISYIEKSRPIVQTSEVKPEILISRAQTVQSGGVELLHTPSLRAIIDFYINFRILCQTSTSKFVLDSLNFADNWYYILNELLLAFSNLSSPEHISIRIGPKAALVADIIRIVNICEAEGNDSKISKFVRFFAAMGAALNPLTFRTAEEWLVPEYTKANTIIAEIRGIDKASLEYYQQFFHKVLLVLINIGQAQTLRSTRRRINSSGNLIMSTSPGGGRRKTRKSKRRSKKRHTRRR